jgi:hypothetical protein
MLIILTHKALAITKKENVKNTFVIKMAPHLRQLALKCQPYPCRETTVITVRTKDKGERNRKNIRIISVGHVPVLAD